jgi:hypothetical protein
MAAKMEHEAQSSEVRFAGYSAHRCPHRRDAAGTLEILKSYFGGTPIREEYLIVDSGALAGTGAKSYKLDRTKLLSVGPASRTRLHRSLGALPTDMFAINIASLQTDRQGVQFAIHNATSR